jgi:hypothetical protein
VTVFYALSASPPSGEVLASYGTPVYGDKVERSPSETPPKSGLTYEAHYFLNPSPRDLTAREAAAVLPNIARKVAAEHPEVVVRYADIRYESPTQVAVIQFSPYEASPLPPLGVVIYWLVLAIIAAVAIAVILVVVAPALKFVYEVVTKPMPAVVMWAVWLIPVAIAGYVIYRVVSPAFKKKSGGKS